MNIGPPVYEANACGGQAHGRAMSSIGDANKQQWPFVTNNLKQMHSSLLRLEGARKRNSRTVRVLKKLRPQNFSFSWTVITSSQNSPCTTPFLDCYHTLPPPSGVWLPISVTQWASVCPINSRLLYSLGLGIWGSGDEQVQSSVPRVGAREPTPYISIITFYFWWLCTSVLSSLCVHVCVFV